MKVLFIWANRDQFGFKPLSISLLSAILKQRGHEVELFDTTFIDFGYVANTNEREKAGIFKPIDFGDYDVIKKKVSLKDELETRLKKFVPDVVCISAISDEIYVGFDIAKIVKNFNKNIIVLWGNKSASVSPEKIMKCNDVDYLCIGEGIEFLPEILDMISIKGNVFGINNLVYRYNDKIIRNDVRKYYPNLDDLPYLDWDIFDERQFIKPYDGKICRGGDHMLTWGCPNHCTYCITDYYRKLCKVSIKDYIRRYSVDRIIKELLFLVDKWDLNFFKFHDEDFIIKPLDYFIHLAKEYSDNIDVPFSCMVNAKNVTEEKVKLMVKMNCVSVTVGIETGNEYLRREILGRIETKKDIVYAIRLLNDYGVRTSSFNMLGIPFETKETLEETVMLNRISGVESPNVGFFFPFEGTEARKISVDNGFFDEDSDKVLRSDVPSLSFKNLSEDELIDFRNNFVLRVKGECYGDK